MSFSLRSARGILSDDFAEQSLLLRLFKTNNKSWNYFRCIDYSPWISRWDLLSWNVLHQIEIFRFFAFAVNDCRNVYFFEFVFAIAKTATSVAAPMESIAELT